MFNQIHFVQNLTTGEIECFGTKFLPATNVKGSRFSYCKTNLGLEKRGPAKIVSWSHEAATGQDGQLQHVLGPEWYVMHNFEIFNRLGTLVNLLKSKDAAKERGW
jgi:hypothetical protein